MKVAIIGCGLIGRKRADAIQEEGQDEIVACLDSDETQRKMFGEKYECPSFLSMEELLQKVSPDSVVVSVVNKYAMPYVMKALDANLHVLAEKPLGRNVGESSQMLDFLDQKKGTFVALKTGFNLRFHPAIRRAKELMEGGAIGRLFFIRAQYGHGGRPGMEKEWRASKDLCGGGELLDQGVHIVDLCRFFAGDIASVSATLKTYFWEMDVEDTAFVQMATKEGVDIQFQVGWTLWKNSFSFEVFGEMGYLRIQGLGGSYGEESLEWGLRNPKGGAPEVHREVFSDSSSCWLSEWQEYKQAILEMRQPRASGLDGYLANQVIDAIYRSSKEGRLIAL